MHVRVLILAILVAAPALAEPGGTPHDMVARDQVGYHVTTPAQRSPAAALALALDARSGPALWEAASLRTASDAPADPAPGARLRVRVAHRGPFRRGR